MRVLFQVAAFAGRSRQEGGLLACADWLPAPDAKCQLRRCRYVQRTVGEEMFWRCRDRVAMDGNWLSYLSPHSLLSTCGMVTSIRPYAWPLQVLFILLRAMPSHSCAGRIWPCSALLYVCGLSFLGLAMRLQASTSCHADCLAAGVRLGLEVIAHEKTGGRLVNGRTEQRR